MTVISCECGCKCNIESRDNRGRIRRFVHGHNNRQPGSADRRRERKRVFAKRWYYKNYDRLEEKRTRECVTLRERSRAYYAANRHLQIARAHASIARRAQAKGFHTAAQWLDRVHYFGWRCRYCHTDLNDATLTKDHTIALFCGGTNWPANLVPACAACNYKKKTRPYRLFLGNR